uniref:Uncharacterized protein n=1 Tax=Pogona vitticeps TaxID=103695 RepID=A0ABM5FIG6_9SAUR
MDAVAKTGMDCQLADQVQKETELILRPYANWEAYLIPGPLSIAILGELARISVSQGDFSINTNPRRGGFKHITSPESSLATLMQVSNTGWEAFSTAHKNMDKIRLLSMSIPEQMKILIQILSQDIEVVTTLLPGQLNNIKTVADKCISLALAVENKFSEVIHLIQEVLEACLNSKSEYKKKIEETERILKVLNEKEMQAKKAQQLAEEYCKRVKERTEATFDDYRMAVKNIPEGWAAVGMELVESMTANISILYIFFATLMFGRCPSNKVNSSAKRGIDKPEDTKVNSSAKCETDTPEDKEVNSSAECEIDKLEDKEVNSSAKCDTDKPEDKSQDEPDSRTEEDPIALCNIYCQAPLLIFLGNNLNQLVDEEGNLKMDLLYNEKDKKVNSSWIKENAEQLRDKINQEKDCSMKNVFLEICNSIIDLCQKLSEVVVSAEPTTGKKDLKKKIKRVVQKIAHFDRKSKSHAQAAMLVPMIPDAKKYKPWFEDKLQEFGVVSKATFKLTHHQELLMTTEEQYQRSIENLEEKNEELIDILNHMRKCETKEIDFEKARKMLIDGLSAFEQVKEQWENMVRFFQMISSLTESCLNCRITEFVSSAESVQKIASYFSNDFLKDLIYKQASSASNVAHLVHMISSTYTEISSQYLLGSISSLGRLISMDPSNPSFEEECRKLAHGCNSAQNAIKGLILQRKKEFENCVYGRVAEFSLEQKADLLEVIGEEKRAVEYHADGCEHLPFEEK